MRADRSTVLVRPAERPAAQVRVGRVAPDPVGRTSVSRARLRVRQTVAVLVVATVAVSGWALVRAALRDAGGGPLAAAGGSGAVRPIAAGVWIVRPGDTLWSIAAAVHPRGDIRPLVDRLVAETHGAPLFPGEPIALP